LLVTYNNTLVRYLQYLVSETHGKIRVETYSKFARGYLKSIGKMPPRNGILQTKHLRNEVANAVREVRKTSPLNDFLNLDTGFFMDELAWIADMGITNCQQ